MICRLKDIAIVKAGNSAPDKDRLSNSGTPFIRAGSLEFLARNESIDNCEKIGELEAKNLKLNLFPKDSILFAKSGMSATMGRIYQLPKDAYVVSHLAVITPKQDLVSSGFLKYYFIGKPPLYLIKDEAYPSIKISDIENIELDLPDLETQNKIVSILDKANLLIQKRQQTIVMLEQLLTAKFLEMFGSIASFESTPTSKPLGNYIRIKHGFAFKSNYFVDAGKYFLLTPGNFREDGGFKDRGEKQKFYNGPIPQGYILNKNDLLVAMTEQAPGLLGSPIFIPKEDTFLHNQRLGLIELKDKRINKNFLFQFFNSKITREIIQARSTGVKVKHTSPSKIEAIEVDLPSYQLQNAFGEFSEKINKVLVNCNKALKLVTNFFNGVLQMAFAGKLKLNVAFELETLLKEIDLQKPQNDLVNIASNEEYLLSIVNRLNKQDFENQESYNKAKYVAFQLLKQEERLTQEYDKKSKSLKLVVK